MIRLVTLLCLTVAVLGFPRQGVSRFGGRIVGGANVAKIEDHPYQLSLYIGGFYECGAVIISPLWAVTAAQCAGGSIANMHLRAGSLKHDDDADGDKRDVSQKIVHLNYDQATSDYDIALLKVVTPFTFSDKIKAIGLPTPNEEFADGTDAIVIGWGVTSPGGVRPTNLKFVNVPLVSLEDCQMKYGATTVTERMVCAAEELGGVDACQGDSGGPLLIKAGDPDTEPDMFVGIVSWGRGCALPGYPGVYTRVASFRDWILANAGV